MYGFLLRRIPSFGWSSSPEEDDISYGFSLLGASYGKPDFHLLTRPILSDA
jgi:hypothetical protein